MPVPLNDLGNALTTQIYQTVMGSDGSVKPPDDDTFFTWVMPGLPFTADDLDFASQGIFSAPDAETQNKRALHAFNLSILLDFIPDVGAAFSSERQEGMFKPDAEKRLSEIYRQILRFSRVVDTPLTPEEEAKLQKFRGLLWETTMVKDLVTDEETEVTQPSPVMKAYNDRMAKYLDAVIEYNAKRVAAAGATGAEGKAASADFILNQQLYAMKVKAAADAWTSDGHRNDVDRINAFINQTTQRSMVMWKQQLLERYEQAQISTPEIAIPFPYTTLVPGNIANSDGWTTLEVTHNHTQWAKDNSSTSWSAGGGVNYGLFSINAEGGRETSKSSETHQVNDFSMTFEVAQALIVRAGFYPEFLASRGWTLGTGEGWTFDAMPSDGERPPHGEFIGYATQAIFVRGVEIISKDFVSAYHATASKVTAGGGVGWGPIRLKGSYSKSTSHEDFDATTDGEKLSVKGMQIVGFVNHLIGKAPNPMEGLKDEQFV